MKITFDTSQVKELSYIKELLEEKDWFDKERFPIYWPNNLDHLEEEIEKVSDKVSTHKKWVEKEWKKIEKQYFKAVKELKFVKLSKQYTCHISNFGVEGSYHSPNKLSVRIRNNKDKSRVIETIGHELLHLVFNDYFTKKKFNYQEREWLVDQVILDTSLSKLFPKYEAQSIGKPKPSILKRIID